MKPQFVWFGTLSICFTIVFGIFGCKGSTPATEAEYGAMVVPKPSGPSCEPNPCLDGDEGKDRCVLTPLGTSCACNEFYTPDGDGCVYAGERAEVSSPNSDLDLEAENPVFTAVIEVVGMDNQPISDATLQMGNFLYSPNSANEFRIADVAFGVENIGIVKAPGYAPSVKMVTWMTAGQQKLVIRPMAVEVTESFDSAVGQAVDAENVAVQIAGETFTRIVTGEDGVNRVETYQGTVNLQVASVDPEEESIASAPGEMLGLDLGSQETALVSGGMLSIEATDEDGGPLTVRDGRSVNVNFHIPADFEAVEGDEMPLWYFNKDTNRWEQEGSCTIQEVTSERRQARHPDRKLECVGEVRHFSWWNLDKATQTKCANFPLEIDVPKGYMLAHVTGYHIGSKDDGGVTFEFFNGSHCAAFVQPITYPVEIGFGITLARESDGARFVFLHRTTVQEGDLLDYAFDGRADGGICGDESRCAQKTILVSASTFLDSSGNLTASVVDEDGDGFYIQLRDDLVVNSAAEFDCDDDDGAVNPGATEVPCNGIDDNCDGDTDSGTDVVQYQDISASDWNRWCGQSCYEKTDEIEGNDYDEDCDGQVLDADGDGELSVSHGGADCDDFSATTYPGADEVWGNTADENCDGYQADADGDGFLSPIYCANVALTADEVKLCTDCVDYDATISPESTRSESYLSDPMFFECTGTSGESGCDNFKRRAKFCDYFGNKDTISKNSFLLTQDYNCDGVASDLDGDGFTAPGDYSRGLENSWDCDDMDPRVRPLATSSDPLVAPECGLVDSLDGGNESECEVDLSSSGSYAGDNDAGAGTKCGKMADGYQPACVDLLDPTGAFTGIFVCSPGHKGLYTKPPNPYGFEKGEDGTVYGQAWAPCDANGALPACQKNPGCTDILDAAGQPTGEQKCQPSLWCIGGFKFQETYLEKLKDWAKDGVDLDGDGENDLNAEWTFDLTGTETQSVCTTACGTLCTNNPCLEPNKGTCSLDPTPPPTTSCSCSPGYFGDDCSNCAAGFHDGGGGVCVKEGFCVEGYQYEGDGDGICVDSGS